MSWSRKTSNGVFSRVNSCFNGKKGKVFCITSWLAMKSGYTTITLSIEDRGVSPSMYQHRWQSRISMIWSFYFASMESAGYSLLWAAQTERKIGRSLSITIDAYESSIEGKTVEIPAGISAYTSKDTTK